MSGIRGAFLRATLLAAVALAVASSAVGMTLTRLGPGGVGIAVGPSGEIWVTNMGEILRIDPASRTTRTYPLNQGGAYIGGYAQGVTVGPDGSIWFGIQGQQDPAQPGATPRQTVGRMTPEGAVTVFPIAGPDRASTGPGSVLFATTPDSTIWFTLRNPGGLGRIRPGGAPELASAFDGGALSIVASSSGTLWYDYYLSGNYNDRFIGRLEPGGFPREFLVPPYVASSGLPAEPYLLAEASDGTIWATGYNAPILYRIYPYGTISIVSIPNYKQGNCQYQSFLSGIALARDGNLWAVGCGQIARVSPSGDVALFAFDGWASEAKATPDGKVVFASVSGTFLLDPLATLPSDFSVSVSPAGVSLPPGGTAALTVLLATNSGFNKGVSLSVSGLPPDVVPRFSTSYGGLGPWTLELTAGEGATPGTYPLVITASGGGQTQTAEVALTIQPPPAVVRLVPIALDVVTETAHYRTGLAIANRSAREIAVTAHYTAALGEKTGGGVVSFTLAPTTQRQVPDVLELLRGSGLSIPPATLGKPHGGTIRFVFEGGASEDEIGITALTASPTTPPVPPGVAGLAYPGVDLSGLTSSSLVVYGLRSNPTDRSNLAVFNGGSVPVTVRVTLLSGSGDRRSVVFREAETIGPYGWIQYSGVLDAVGMTNGYARVDRVSDDGSFSAYGVVNDNVTNDGSFVPASFEHFSGTGLTVPVIVESSLYRTELTLANRGSEVRTLRLTYTESAASERGRAFEVTQTLQPGEQLLIPEATQFLREQGAALGTGETYAGSLRIRTDKALEELTEVFAGVRITKELAGGGRVGVFLPAVYSGQEAGDEAYLYGLRADDASRTNVAVVNCRADGTGSLSVALDLYESGTGRLAGTETVALDPGGWYQISDVLRRHGIGNGWIKARRVAGQAPWMAYAVVNDGAAPGTTTDDGAAVPMVKAMP